ncbi:MAG: hypothetical protein ABIQ31_17885 [Ferruginibacter sp.]
MYKFFLQRFKRNLLHFNGKKSIRLYIRISKPLPNLLIFKTLTMDEKEIANIVQLIEKILEVVKPCLKKKQQFNFIRVGIAEVKRSIIPVDEKVTALFDIDKDTYNKVAKIAIDLGLTTDELLRRLCWAITVQTEQTNGTKALPVKQA